MNTHGQQILSSATQSLYTDERKEDEEMRDELLAAASELEWTIRKVNERSTP